MVKKGGQKARQLSCSCRRALVHRFKTDSSDHPNLCKPVWSKTCLGSRPHRGRVVDLPTHVDPPFMVIGWVKGVQRAAFRGGAETCWPRRHRLAGGRGARWTHLACGRCWLRCGALFLPSPNRVCRLNPGMAP